MHTNIINKHTKIYYPYYNNINKSIIFVEEMNNQNITINNEYYALQAGGHRFEPCISHRNNKGFKRNSLKPFFHLHTICTKTPFIANILYSLLTHLLPKI